MLVGARSVTVSAAGRRFLASESPPPRASDGSCRAHARAYMRARVRICAVEKAAHAATERARQRVCGGGGVFGAAHPARLPQVRGDVLGELPHTPRAATRAAHPARSHKGAVHTAANDCGVLPAQPPPAPPRPSPGPPPALTFRTRPCIRLLRAVYTRAALDLPDSRVYTQADMQGSSRPVSSLANSCIQYYTRSSGQSRVYSSLSFRTRPPPPLPLLPCMQARVGRARASRGSWPVSSLRPGRTSS